MGLASALNTALTGLSAAETTIDVVGNNLANSNTVGFKASQANFATQFLQTRSLGSAPTTSSGGTNPRQIGLGTMVADITPNFNQGTIEISSNPTDLAIQGDGFFIVQGGSGEEFYTRNGIFKLNSQSQLVTITGNRVLGLGVDENYQIQTSTTLEPLAIPLGSTAVAQATNNVFLDGTLSPTGDVADTAEIIQTAILGDQSYTAPASGTTITQSVPPNVSGPPPTSLTGQAGGGSLTLLGTYQYRVLFADGVVGSLTDTEGVASAAVGPVTLVGAEDQILLADIPVDAGGTYSTRRLYRSNDGGTTYNFVGEISDNVTTTYTDTLSDAAAAANPAINQNTITGNYSYYITFADVPGGPGVGTESRPSAAIGPQNAVAGRIQLGSLPVDAGGQWNVRRIYRNLNGGSTFHFLTEINDVTTAGLTFTDNIADSAISGNATIDFDGPRIDNATLLTDVLSRTDSTYTQVFQEGTLAFTGRKGGRALGAQQLQITSTTTVLDLVNFMEAAVGIQSVPGPDPLNPIPSDTGSGSNPGGTVTTDGQIRFVSNNGTGNALSIDGSGLTLTTTSGTSGIALPFNSTQAAVGESAVTAFEVYDSLGIPLSVTLTAVLESKDGNSTTYRWFADSSDNAPASGVDITVGTGLITFDGNGDFLSATESTVSIERATVSSTSPLEFELDFAQISGLAATESTLAVSRQDGSAPGVLTSFIIGEDGVIRGVFSNGSTRDLGQIRLARFANPNGLEQKGENVYTTGVNSGLPQVNNPGAGGNGSIIAGASELSNTDIGSNLIDLILASTMYRGNTRVITTAQQMLDELLSLRR